MPKFEIGDVVQLKGSDRQIVVEGFVEIEPGIVDHGRVVCAWIDNYGKPQRETYNEKSLEPTPKN